MPAGARFVFILSPERSGTTLRSAVLGGHSQVVAPGELHLLRYATLGQWRREYPAAGASLESLCRSVGWPAAPTDDDLSPLDLYARIRDAAPSGSFVADKSPAYARDAAALRRAESLRPLYVWLVRHPLGVAASRIARHESFRKSYNWGHLSSFLKYPGFVLRERIRRWTGREIAALAEDWAEVHARIRDFLTERPPERWLRVHYEGLVREPREVAEALCAFLELDFEPAMLDPRGNAPAELRWGVGDEKLLETEGIAADAADAWRRDHDARLLPPSVAELAEQIGVQL